jgi:single-strand DNA-binding protein
MTSREARRFIQGGIMGDMAIAVLVGRLTRDAELKYTNSGTAVCGFDIATNSRINEGGQWVDKPSYWSVAMFGKKAEGVAQYLTKGKQVAVNGEMRVESWEKNGEKHSKVKITAQDVALLGSREDSAERQEPRRSPPKPKQAPPEDNFTDDIPF